MKNKITHGESLSLDELLNTPSTSSGTLNDFDYMFPLTLERLPSDAASIGTMIQGLTDLGNAMVNSPTNDDSNISANFTYVGQFLDHDITLTAIRDAEAGAINNPIFPIVDPTQINSVIRNVRTGSNDLDSLYQTAAVTPDGHFALGKLSGEVGGVTDGHDLPRDPNNVPLIGDTRNDENLAVAQTHVAFLRFHNAIMDKENVNADDAQKLLTQHYQNIILNDFLAQVVNPEYIKQALIYGNRFFKTGQNFFIPIEFTMAAYRLGHSMIREIYDFSANFPMASLNQLFNFSSSGGSVPAPEIWKIDWSHFKNNTAKKIDTSIINVLASVPGLNINLAARNLRRGYMFNLPIGQAVADFVLSDKSLILSANEILNNSSPAEQAALSANNFQNKTPLWYYILKEAQIRENGNRLGPVGTAIVAEVFIGTLLNSKFSILKEKDWKPTLASSQPGKFTFEDMLRYTGLL